MKSNLLSTHLSSRAAPDHPSIKSYMLSLTGLGPDSFLSNITVFIENNSNKHLLKKKKYE